MTENRVVALRRKGAFGDGIADRWVTEKPASSSSPVSRLGR